MISMAMEGINWGEVNTQVIQLNECFSTLKNELNKLDYTFGEELATAWASGNAITFGNTLKTKDHNVSSLVSNSWAIISSYVKNAANIYANTFNVANNISIPGFLSSSGTGMPDGAFFKETLNGTTGMNKDIVKNLLVDYTKTVNNLLDDFNSDVKNIEISIFDAANSQKDAFKSAVLELVSSIKKEVINMGTELSRLIESEVENVDIAKSQTVSTFNN
jgi:hypothetical protein